MKDNTQGHTRRFELVVDKLPYEIKVTPQAYNDEKRFLIEVNGDEGHVYAWDTDLVRLRALDDDAATLPDGLEEAISNMLVKTISL